MKFDSLVAKRAGRVFLAKSGLIVFAGLWFWYAGVPSVVCVMMVVASLLPLLFGGNVHMGLLLANVTGTLWLAFDLAELTGLLLAVLTEHLQIVRIGLFGMCMSLLVRQDLLAALRTTRTAREPLEFLVNVFCPLHRFGNFLKRYTWAALVPIIPMGFVDPADAVGAGRYIWAADELQDEPSQRLARAAVLCASVTGAMLPCSVWWFFFTGTANMFAGAAPSFIPLGIIAYGIGSYCHGSWLISRAWSVNRQSVEVSDQCRIATPYFRGYFASVLVIGSLLLSVWFAIQAVRGPDVQSLDAPTTLDKSSSTHESDVLLLPNGTMQIEAKVQSGEMGYVGMLVVLLIALLVGRMIYEARLPSDGGVVKELKQRGLYGHSWTLLGHGVSGVSEACLIAVLVMIFNSIVYGAIKASPSSQLLYFVPWIGLVLLIYVAGKPFVVFGIGLALFGMVNGGNVPTSFEIQALAIAAAFASQFAPASLSTDYMFNGEIGRWRDILKNIGPWPIMWQGAIALIAICIARGQV